jgi:3-methyladenine DNA glycosylase AlkD
MDTTDAILAHLHNLGNPASLAGMARYGINTAHALGVPVPALRALAKEHRRNHLLALALWDTGVHDARLLAVFVGDPARVTPDQMEEWAGDFDSWDLCDQCCSNLFVRTPYAPEKVRAWTARPGEFVKRAGFVLAAAMAVHDRMRDDAFFIDVLALVVRESDDARNYVKKGVNWALRQIGKRNALLHARACETAESLRGMQDRTARWIGADALRDLHTDTTLRRIAKR